VACLIFAGLAIAEIPLAYLVRRILLVLPLILLIALAVPLSRGMRSGWDLAAQIAVRAVVSFLAALWLVNTTPFERLLIGLRELGMPRVFVAMLAFTYRYLYVVFDELARMRTAQRARTFGARRPWAIWKSTAGLVAVLIIRSLNRAERVHNAMLARGWRGDVHTLEWKSSRVEELKSD
jgi:cobalt/nickel transport system permease protein